MSTIQATRHPHRAPAGTSRPSAAPATRALLKVAIRQDAPSIAPWVVLISVLSASSVLIYAWIFPDAADRTALATAMHGNPALSLIFGPARDLSTSDGFNAWRAGQLGAFFAGLMTILIVIRNSRADEDSGRAELLASGVLARESRLAVALAMATLASVALGVVCFVLTVACGGGLVATLVLSATFTASGLMFAGVAAIAAQLGSEARTASSLAIATLAVCFVARGYIDTSGGDDWMTWLTPLGWLAEARPATGNNPWPLLVALAFAGALIAVAFVLQGRRDFGQGLLAGRPGPAEAGLAGTVWGLAVKLNRGALVSWSIGLALLGLVLGNLASSVGDVLADNPAMATILASGAVTVSDLTFAFLITILQLIAIITAVMGVQMIQRVHTEEIDLRVEPLLAGSLHRSTYLASNVVVALVGSGVAMMLAGTGLGIVASATDSSISVGEVVRQALVTIPGAWVLVALAVAVVGAAPGKRLVGWLGIVATFGLTILGPTFRLPDWALSISPLRHVPNVTAASPDWVGFVVLIGVVVALLVVGFVGFRRRDVL